MLWLAPRRRLPVVIALLVILIVVGTIVTHSRGPAADAGATYTGTVVVQTRSGAVAQRLSLSFAVSTTGHRVASVRLPDGVPSTCPRSRLGQVTVGSGSAAIVTPSTFRLALALIHDGRVGTLLVSGVFHTFSRESGAVSSSFSAAGLSGCGTGAGYTAKATS